MKWTEDKIEILKNGILNNLSYADIGNLLNTNFNSVRLKAQKLGLKSTYLESLNEIIECKNCNIKFQSLISNKRIYCSQKCGAILNNKTRFRLKIEKLNIECKNCRKQYSTNKKDSKYCSQGCHRDFEYKDNIKKWKNGEILGYTGKTKALSKFIRKYLFETRGCKCEKCGWDELHPVDKRPLVEINHIDGNAENNKEENLEILCPNYHSMTHNFRARNKNSTRVRK